jgi:glutamate-1-semialdehyde aminotransferase
LFLVAPLSQISALTISEEELQRLEAIFKELSTANATLQAQLNDSTALLLKAQVSFNEYAKEAEKVVVDLQVEKDRLAAQKNGWRAATLVTGAITVGVVLTFLLLK